MKRLTCVCSALLLAAAAFGSDLTEFRDRVVAASGEEQFWAVLEEAPESVVQDDELLYYLNDDGSDWEIVQTMLSEEIAGRIAMGREPAAGEVAVPAETAVDILKSPVYVDREERTGRNWIDASGDRIGQKLVQWLSDVLGWLFPSGLRGGSGVAGPRLTGLQVIAWMLIFGVIAVVLVFVIKNFAGIGRKRRVGRLLEEDEPERTSDQWLEQADRLEGEDRLREAVRCLYLACLVRFDDGRIARFRRHETNWEHLYRIEANPDLPAGIDFRRPTQRFDKIWYGHEIKGTADVQEFREVYKQICEALLSKTAA
ncbi:MAG: DUF4129 domain-containing protein [Armatimonadetes bacterium]|nr:DUF4129 domain-containing protein [Armatimonadota bacterium]